MNELIDYKAAYERQRRARALAEDTLENKSRELYEKNESLIAAYNKLKLQKDQILHQEKLASIGQLAAGVAHEINNPTGFVKANINALRRYTDKFKKMLLFYEQTLNQVHLNALDLEKGLSDVLAKKNELRIDSILNDLDLLFSESIYGLSCIEDIVNNLKSFARPDSKKSVLFNFNDCINDTFKLVQNEIKYKAELDVNLQPVPDSMGYPGEISQVILNLLVNASHAIDDSGKIKVSTDHVDEQIILDISDNGCGIAKDDLDKIFDPFFTTKDVDSGTGLGLSITYGIVKKHGGSINVCSEVNQGTTFRLSFPVLSNPLESQEAS